MDDPDLDMLVRVVQVLQSGDTVWNPCNRHDFEISHNQRSVMNLRHKEDLWQVEQLTDCSSLPVSTSHTDSRNHPLLSAAYLTISVHRMDERCGADVPRHE